MSKFENELKEGRFTVSECAKCGKISWPPGYFCSNCFEELIHRPIRQPGVLVEFSSGSDGAFGIAEFEGTVRVMGRIKSKAGLKSGNKVLIAKCGYENGPKIEFDVM